jgi:multiple sugar transport system substrate-binding protein
MDANRNSRAMTRREMIHRGVRWGLGAAAAGAVLDGRFTLTPAPVEAASEDTLDFLVWTYSVETIQRNVNDFQAHNPPIKVSLKDIAWGEYHSGVVARMTAKTPTDVLYCSDHWLQEWAAAGWIAPLQDYFPQVKNYIPDLAPFSVQGMTYQKKLYGLPYYSDTIDFLYNATHLAKAGIAQPPATWSELSQQAKILKSKGVSQYPVGLAFSQTEPFSIEIFTSMIFSEGGSMFDAAYNPVFAESNSAAAHIVDWVRQGLKDGLISADSLTASEPDVLKGLQADVHTYTLLPSYDLADLNSPTSRVSGQFKMSLIPGTTHNTVGYARFYAMTNMATQRGKTVTDGSWKFIEFMGGKTNGQYLIAKRWAVEKGLGFAEISLLSDKDVAAAFSKWVDVSILRNQIKLAKAKDGLTPFYGVWEVKARAELQQAYLGKQSVPDVLKSLAGEWNKLKKA